MFAFAVAAAAAVAIAAPVYTLTLDNPSPRHGDTVTFTGTFPHEAFRQAHNPQFHDNPYVSVLCSSDDGTRVLATQTSFPDKDGRNDDGTITADSWPLVLDSPAWPAGAAAFCSAASGWWTADKDGVQFHPVASLFFDVAADQ